MSEARSIPNGHAIHTILDSLVGANTT